MSRASALALLASLALAARPATAQPATPAATAPAAVTREASLLRAPDGKALPSIPRDADPLDWETWYDRGVTLLKFDGRAAERAFARAAQLRPDRAEPFVARWVAVHVSDPERFARYLDDDARTLRDPRVARADSVRDLAFRRNPFVHQGLTMVVFDALPGYWGHDDATRGWLALANADLFKAAHFFGEVLRRQPERNPWLRFVRASALLNAGKPDSAQAELTTLLAARRARDARLTVRSYESKALLEYAVGLIHLAARRDGAAREAFGRALEEDAAFAPAHAVLGTMPGPAAAALHELTLATELAPDDPLYHRWHADALAQAGQGAEAIAALRRATALAPHWAEPHRRLAALLAAAGDAEGARAATAAWLERAPRGDPARATAGR